MEVASWTGDCWRGETPKWIKDEGKGVGTGVAQWPVHAVARCCTQLHAVQLLLTRSKFVNTDRRAIFSTFSSAASVGRMAFIFFFNFGNEIRFFLRRWPKMESHRHQMQMRAAAVSSNIPIHHAPSAAHLCRLESNQMISFEPWKNVGMNRTGGHRWRTQFNWKMSKCQTLQFNRNLIHLIDGQWNGREKSHRGDFAVSKSNPFSQRTTLKELEGLPDIDGQSCLFGNKVSDGWSTCYNNEVN